jgi:ribose/xylose/arabinose/galactoside ABC-type transport system permease subunit
MALRVLNEEPFFRDRTDAGRRLAEALADYADTNPLILGIPRGGVVVAAEAARDLGAELDVIAAVVIGGASLSGGQGTISGTIVGTLLISFLRNGCTLLGISTNAQYVVIGMIIVLAVSVDQLAQGRAARL